MSNKKEELIVHLASNKSWGGGEQYIKDLAIALQEDRHKLFIGCRDKKVATLINECGIRTVKLPLRGFFDLVSPIKLLYKTKNAEKLIIHCHNFKDAFTAALLKLFRPKTKIILTRHLVKKAKNDCIHRFIYKSIDKVIFVSCLAQNRFNEGKNNLALSKQIVILNGVKSIKDDRGSGLLSNLDQPIIMYHGRLAAEKGVETLLRAVASIKVPYKLVIIGAGDPSYQQYMCNLVEELNIRENVFFLGFRKNAPALIKYATFGVCPSLVREACSLSCMEYMMNEKAVIATNNGAQTEYLTDGETALLVSPGDIEELKSKIQLLLNDKNLCDSMGAKAKLYFDENLTYGHFYRRINKVYQQL